MSLWSIGWRTEIVFEGKKMSSILVKLEIDGCTGHLLRRKAVFGPSVQNFIIIIIVIIITIICF